MEELLRDEEQPIKPSPEKMPYEKPSMEEHEPLEEATAYIYYYYTW